MKNPGDSIIDRLQMQNVQRIWIWEDVKQLPGGAKQAESEPHNLFKRSRQEVRLSLLEDKDPYPKHLESGHC